MAMAVTLTGQSQDAQSGLACSALSVQLGDVDIDLPALSANYSDYAHASRARMPLDAHVFNYYHRDSAGYPISHTSTQNNIESRVRSVQASHSPPLAILSLEHPGDLTDRGLGAFHELQMRLGLHVITTVEKNPMQGLDALRAELEAFDRLETDREKFPTISVKCDPADFRAKLMHIVDNYGGFNLQWGGHGQFAAQWGILPAVLRDRPVWCNVVGILNRTASIAAQDGQKIRTTGAARPLLYGGCSYCFAWPHFHSPPPVGGEEFGGQTPKSTLFNPETWCYEPRRLEYSVARTKSFNAIQGALGVAREEIRAGTLYSRHCDQRLGLRAALGQLGGS